MISMYPLKDLPINYWFRYWYYSCHNQLSRTCILPLSHSLHHCSASTELHILVVDAVTFDCCNSKRLNIFGGNRDYSVLHNGHGDICPSNRILVMQYGDSTPPAVSNMSMMDQEPD